MLASMHAMVLRNPGPDADFECTQCPLPEPGPGQVRIRVAASSVNPLDLKLASGQVALLPPAPSILHGDVAGIVDAVGVDVLTFSPGDEVLGFAGGVAGHPGALAEYMLADERLITRKPRRLSFMEAAALPGGVHHRLAGTGGAWPTGGGTARADPRWCRWRRPCGLADRALHGRGSRHHGVQR